MRFLSLLLTIATGAYTESSPFDPEFSRHVMLPLTAAAYASDPAACLATVSENVNMLYFNQTSCPVVFADMCAGFAAELLDRNAVVLSFRGTVGKLQLFDDLVKTIAVKKVPIDLGGAVGPYFKEAFDSLWEGGMKSAMSSYASQKEGKELWITGHSLGASMASIAAATIVHMNLWPADKIRLMTYGEPRTGNEEYAEAMDSNILAMHRVVHRYDPIVHVPPRHILLLPTHYKHHGQEIYYKTDMSNITDFVACNGDEDKKCSHSVAFDDYNEEDHRNYYGLKLSVWGPNGCTGSTEMAQESSPAALHAKESDIRLNAYATRRKFRE